MSKPTKAELIEIRKSTYRDQLPERCCGTCRYFHRWGGHHEGQCHRIEIRGVLQLFPHAGDSWIPATGLCDLYEPKGE